MSPKTGLDLDALLDRIHHNRAALDQLVALLLEHLPARRAAVAAAIAADDSDAVLRAAHAIKGTLANFTVGASWQTAGALEALARTGTLVGADQLHATLEAELDALVAELRQARGDAQP